MHKYLKISIVSLLLISSFNSIKAQSTDALGTFTPYSIYGLGDIALNGTSYNLGMGGIGLGVRDMTIINYSNIASITARDTLSFMMDFGIIQRNNYLKDYARSTAYNVFNMYNIVLSVPIYNKHSIIFGITPYSNVGYKFQSTEQDKDIIHELGNIQYQQYGLGYINRAFFGGAVLIAKRLSLGFEGMYYFGNITKKNTALFSDTYNKSLLYSVEDVLGSFGAKASLQYSQPIGNYELTLGATYNLATTLKGDQTEFINANSSSVTDTIKHTVTDVSYKIPEEMAVGISLRRQDKWLIGFDYIRQDWKNTIFNNPLSSMNFETTIKESFKAGFEFIPNKHDVRYYMKTTTYRGGAYYNKSNISVNGEQINSMGITFGMTFPIRLNYKHNAVTFALDLGQRGTKNSNLIKERYFNLMINVNLHDFWFRKFFYE